MIAFIQLSREFMVKSCPRFLLFVVCVGGFLLCVLHACCVNRHFLNALDLCCPSTEHSNNLQTSKSVQNNESAIPCASSSSTVLNTLNSEEKKNGVNSAEATVPEVNTGKKILVILNKYAFVRHLAYIYIMYLFVSIRVWHNLHAVIRNNILNCFILIFNVYNLFYILLNIFK